MHFILIPVTGGFQDLILCMFFSYFELLNHRLCEYKHVYSFVCISYYLMFANIRNFTAYRGDMLKYVKTRTLAHESYDDMIHLFESTLSANSNISEQFITVWVPKLVEKIFDFYLRVAANDFITIKLREMKDMIGPMDRLSFRLQVLTDKVRAPKNDECI